MGNWKFWQKKDSAATSANQNAKALPRPKELPAAIGRELVVTMGKQPDWVWSLKAALRERGDDNHIFDFRVFDPGEASLKKIKVPDYNSLENHSELILFEGRFNKRTNEVHFDDILEKKPPRAA